jgi:hypothetical protein
LYDIDLKNDGSGHLSGYESACLQSIQESHINIAIWEREPIPTISHYLQNSDKSSWDDLEVNIKPGEEDNLDDLKSYLPSSGNGFSIGKVDLVEDVKKLAKIFFEIESIEARVSLEFVDYDMCRLFHVDKMRLRLLCTYSGMGTEWLPNNFVNRKELGKGCNSKIVLSENSVRHFNCFDVGLLKGEFYPRNQNNGVVHRSPPIENSKQNWRVLLKIDSGRSNA